MAQKCGQVSKDWEPPQFDKNRFSNANASQLQAQDRNMIGTKHIYTIDTGSLFVADTYKNKVYVSFVVVRFVRGVHMMKKALLFNCHFPCRLVMFWVATWPCLWPRTALWEFGRVCMELNFECH